MLDIKDIAFRVLETANEIREKRAGQITDKLTGLLASADIDIGQLSAKEALVIGPGELCPEREALKRLGIEEDLVTEVDQTVQRSQHAGKNFVGGTEIKDYLANHPDTRYSIVTQLRAYYPSRQELERIQQHLDSGGVYVWEEASDAGSTTWRMMNLKSLLTNLGQVFGEQGVVFNQDSRMIAAKNTE